MKKLIGVIVLSTLTLVACDEVEESLDEEDVAALEIATDEETGEGEFELLTSTISTDDTTLSFQASGVDEEKTTFVYVANEKVFEQEIENDQVYDLNISEVEDAYRTDYDPKVQFIQYEENDESENITMFKQLRYSVED